MKKCNMVSKCGLLVISLFASVLLACDLCPDVRLDITNNTEQTLIELRAIDIITGDTDTYALSISAGATASVILPRESVYDLIFEFADGTIITKETIDLTAIDLFAITLQGETNA